MQNISTNAATNSLNGPFVPQNIWVFCARNSPAGASHSWEGHGRAEGLGKEGQTGS